MTDAEKLRGQRKAKKRRKGKRALTLIRRNTVLSNPDVIPKFFFSQCRDERKEPEETRIPLAGVHQKDPHGKRKLRQVKDPDFKAEEYVSPCVHQGIYLHTQGFVKLRINEKCQDAERPVHQNSLRCRTSNRRREASWLKHVTVLHRRNHHHRPWNASDQRASRLRRPLIRSLERCFSDAASDISVKEKPGEEQNAQRRHEFWAAFFRMGPLR